MSIVNKLWDCVIIGAGPAGAIAAKQIAASNKQVLLIDKATFPRTKVCGCCINGSAQAALAKAGLGNVLAENKAVPLNNLLLFDNGKRAKIPLSIGSSLSREKLDMAIINAAQQNGARFLPGTTAKVLSLGGLPRIQIQSPDLIDTIESKIVIVADGLACRSLDLLPQFRSIPQANSRFGAGVVLEDAPASLEPGQIYMACSRRGYVGMVRLEDGRLNVAAAFDRKLSQQFNGAGQAAAYTLNQCSLPIPAQITEAHWTGTDLLTRKRSQIADKRLFIIGDACGYTEPFTGEGIAWALWSGLRVVDLAVLGINLWNQDLIREWHKNQQKVAGQRLRSKMIALTLRSNVLRYSLISMLSILPSSAIPLVREITDAQHA